MRTTGLVARYERNSGVGKFICVIGASAAWNAGCKHRLPTMCVHCRKSVVKTENIKNEPDRLVFLGDGAQKATAVEHYCVLIVYSVN